MLHLQSQQIWECEQEARPRFLIDKMTVWLCICTPYLLIVWKHLSPTCYFILFETSLVVENDKRNDSYLTTYCSVLKVTISFQLLRQCINIKPSQISTTLSLMSPWHSMKTLFNNINAFWKSHKYIPNSHMLTHVEHFLGTMISFSLC